MRVVFMGTPAFAVPSLAALAREHEVALVVTRPDAVRSRGKRLEPSPVKAAALERGLPVVEARRMEPAVLDALRAAGADVFCVAAYGCILPDEVLSMAPLGCVNVHASLLPRWRGAAPIQHAILAGDERTGVSIMRIGQGVDTGAYCAQAGLPVGEMGTEELTAALAELGGGLLVETLPAIADGTAAWIEQDEALATHAGKILKGQLDLAPELTVDENLRRVRAASGSVHSRCALAAPGSHGPRGAETVQVVRAAAGPAEGPLPGWGAFTLANKRLLLGCADGAVEVLELKPAGKQAMGALAWANGRRLSEGRWGRVE